MLALLSALTIGAAHGEDLVVLVPGLGDTRKTRACMESLAPVVKPAGYTLVVADYQRRSSVEASSEALGDFFRSLEPERYERVHVVAWILGGWALNTLLQDAEIPHLASVIYDRSPTQERAPAAVVRVARPAVWLMFGRLVRDLSLTPYPVYTPDPGVSVGIYIENRATELMVKLQRIGKSYGPLHYEPGSFGQPHDDAFYTPLDHDRIYLRHDMLWPEFRSFFEAGRFSDGARRTPMEGDVWQEPAIDARCTLPGAGG